MGRWLVGEHAWGDGCQVRVDMGAEEHVQDWCGAVPASASGGCRQTSGSSRQISEAHDSGGGGGARRREAIWGVLRQRLQGFFVNKIGCKLQSRQVNAISLLAAREAQD